MFVEALKQDHTLSHPCPLFAEALVLTPYVEVAQMADKYLVVSARLIEWKLDVDRKPHVESHSVTGTFLGEQSDDALKIGLIGQWVKEQLEKERTDGEKGKRALALAEALSSGQVTLTIEPGSRQFLTPPAVPESEASKKALELIAKAVADAAKGSL
jgi:hypothetical protein